MTAFEKIVPVRFEDCDPAGIVFYPRYFLMINRLIEDWFGEALGLPWPQMHGVEHSGVPTVRIEIDFRAASRHGEMLRLALDVLEVRRSAFTLDIRAEGADARDIRFQARQTFVYVSTGDGEVKSKALPEDMAARMRAMIVGEEKTA